jgi:hypothetical protein
MKNITVDLKKYEELLSKLDLQTNVSEYTNKIYKYEEIKNETYRQADKATLFADNVYDAESSRHHYEIACIVLIPFLTISALVAFKFKKSWIILISSIILFILIIPACIIIGLNLSHFLLSIDVCKDVNKYITYNMKPIAPRGIGLYASCPSKPVQVMINTAKYELGNSFSEVIEEVNSTIIKNYYGDNLGIYKRNNSHFEYLATKVYINDTYVSKGLFTLVYTNEILRGLDALSQCQMAISIINYTEERFCYLNITYQFNNLFYYFIGIIGLFLLVIGINKLIVLLNPAYQKLDQKMEGMELLEDTVVN